MELEIKDKEKLNNSCENCFWRQQEWRNDGWCYIFREKFNGCKRFSQLGKHPIGDK